MFKIPLKISFSLALLGAMITSANAMQITENYAIDSYVGIGGFYNTSNGDNAKLSYSGGYLSLGGVDVFFDRLQAGGDIKAGYGYNKNSFMNKPNASSIYLDFVAKFGFNTLSTNIPLFVNIILGYDNQFTIRNKGVGRHLATVGAELDGKLPLGSMKLTYSGGYSWVFSGAYNIDNEPYKLSNGHIAHASLGMLINLSDKIAFYTKAIGKYYMLGAADIFPKSKVWSGNLEFGISF